MLKKCNIISENIFVTQITITSSVVKIVNDTNIDDTWYVSE